MKDSAESLGLHSSGVDEVDYILVSNKTLNESESADRRYFETCLKYKGLHVDHAETEYQIFTKLSLPDEVKYKYFEILELRMPLKIESKSSDTDVPLFKIREDVREIEILEKIQKFFLIDRIQNVLKRLKNYYLHEDDDLAQIEQQQFFGLFKEKQRELFDLESAYSKKKIWKILIINFILSRQRGQRRVNDPFENFTCIETLINKKIFTDAFPLHDGTCTDEGTMRNKLYKAWNALYFWKNLPLDDMRDYLGNTCAVYFAWLEFYTRMLFAASVFGILLIVYGLITLPADKFSAGVCGAENITMCPVCDYVCGYYPLSRNCVYAKVAHLFDNDFAIVYSTLMALWACVLSGLWKRRNKVLQRKWNLLDSVDEKSRVQYIAQLQIYRGVTGKNVKKIPLSLKITALTISSWIILLFILLIAIAIISITVYEIWITGVIYSMDNTWLLSRCSFIITFTSSLLNLITINVLNKAYSKVALYLNNREFHRTKAAYDRSLTVKNFAFQFINTYAPILHIALIKDKFIGFPGHYNRVFGYRQTECNYGDCLMELNIQLATIMVGQQIIESFGKLITTFLRANFKQFLSKKETEVNQPLLENVRRNNLGNRYQTIEITNSRYEEDYHLLDYEKEGGLFNEYLELAIQYGFVILFTPAFPLAPLFAWIRNIFEIRFDATKIILFYRRLVPFLNPNMIIWLEIFDFMGSIGVLINAIVIAFSTNIITRFVYSWNNDGDGEGYLNASLSIYSTSDLDRRSIPESSSNITVCYYKGFRQPYWSPYKYESTLLYWHILMAKFVFIILYQNVIFLFKNLILKCIPETPGQLHRFQKEERDFILNSLEPTDPEEMEHPSLKVSQPQNEHTQ